ncbi:hypothetical protein ACG7TL_007389 [Trametes sanguinea]
MITEVTASSTTLWRPWNLVPVWAHWPLALLQRLRMWQNSAWATEEEDAGDRNWMIGAQESGHLRALESREGLLPDQFKEFQLVSFPALAQRIVYTAFQRWDAWRKSSTQYHTYVSSSDAGLQFKVESDWTDPIDYVSAVKEAEAGHSADLIARDACEHDHVIASTLPPLHLVYALPLTRSSRRSAVPPTDLYSESLLFFILGFFDTNLSLLKLVSERLSCFQPPRPDSQASKRPQVSVEATGFLTSPPPASNTGFARTKKKLSPRELAESAFNRLIQALKITKDFSSPCPPLEAAVGALLVALEAYKRYSDAMEALDTLLTRMEPLQSMLRKALEVDYDQCPKALKERLEAFASNVRSVADDAKALRSRRGLARFINASDFAERTEAWVKKLSWYIQTFILEGTIALELTVHEGFTRMEGRFDKLDEGISVANKGINGLREDFDHKLTDDPLRIRLRPVVEARFDHGSSIHVECHTGTRGEVLATICSWLRPDDPCLATLPEPAVPADSDRRILWIYALPGVGKSTIARTAAALWDKDKVLGATFFCAKDGQRSNILGIFRTVAYQLARNCSKFHNELMKVVEKDPDLYAASPVRQLEKLIVEPLKKAVDQGAFHRRVPIIIDALDECTDKAAVSTILTSLALHISKLEPLCILITSRREQHITKGFLERALLECTQQLNLTNVRPDLTKRDIASFVRSRFDDIRRDIPASGRP